MSKIPLISILIPVRNRKELTKNILSQIFTQVSLHKWENHISVIVIDDGSTDGTKEMIFEQFTGVHLIEGDGSLWWTGAIVKGMEYAVHKFNADYLLWLNDDISLADDFLANLVNICSNKKYQDIIVGGLVKDQTYPDWIVYSGSIKHKPVRNISMFLSSNELEVDVLCGNIVIIPRSVIDKIQYPNATKLRHYGGDFEYIMRAKRNGFKVILSSKLNATTDFSMYDVYKYIPYWLQWYLQKGFKPKVKIIQGLLSFKASENVWALVNLHSSNINNQTTPIWKYIFCYFNKVLKLLSIEFLSKQYLDKRMYQYLEQQNFPPDITNKILNRDF